MDFAKKTFHILLLIILSHTFFALNSLSLYSLTNDFSLSASSYSATICGGSMFEGNITILNNLPEPLLITLSPQGQHPEWITLSNYSFFLPPFESANLIEIIRPRHDYYGTHLMSIVISSNKGTNATINQYITLKKCKNINVLVKQTKKEACPCKPLAFDFNITNIGPFTDFFSFSIYSENKSLSNVFYSFTINDIMLRPFESAVTTAYINPSCDIYGDHKLFFVVKSSIANYALKIPLSISLKQLCYNYSLISGFNEIYINLTNYNLQSIEDAEKLHFLLWNSSSFYNYLNYSNNLTPHQQPRQNLTNTSPFNFTLPETVFYFNLTNKHSNKYNLCFNTTYLLPFVLENTAEIANSYNLRVISNDSDFSYLLPETINLFPKSKAIIPLIVMSKKPQNFSITLSAVSSRGNIIKSSEIYISSIDCTGSYSNLSVLDKLTAKINLWWLWLLLLIIILLIFAILLIKKRRKEKQHTGTDLPVEQNKQRDEKKELKKESKKVKKEPETYSRKKFFILLIPLLLLILLLICFLLPYFGFYLFSQAPATNIPDNFSYANNTTQQNASNTTFNSLQEKSFAFIKTSAAYAKSAASFLLSKTKNLFVYSFDLSKKTISLILHFLCRNFAVFFLIVFIIIFTLIILNFFNIGLLNMLSQKIFFIVVLAVILFLFFIFFYFSLITNTCVFVPINRTTTTLVYPDYSLKDNLSSFIIYKDTPKKINFSSYVFDPDNDPISLYVTPAENITISTDGMVVTFVPDKNFFGRRTINLIARDKYGATAYSPNINLIVVNYKKPGAIAKFGSFIIKYIYYIILFLTIASVVMIFMILKSEATKRKTPVFVLRNSKAQKSSGKPKKRKRK